jgi:hypothetical protein
MRLWIYLTACCFLFSHSHSYAEASDKAASDSDESPWLFVPILTSDPQIGTSLGLLGMYLQ